MILGSSRLLLSDKPLKQFVLGRNSLRLTLVFCWWVILCVWFFWKSNMGSRTRLAKPKKKELILNPLRKLSALVWMHLWNPRPHLRHHLSRRTLGRPKRPLFRHSHFAFAPDPGCTCIAFVVALLSIKWEIFWRKTNITPCLLDYFVIWFDVSNQFLFFPIFVLIVFQQNHDFVEIIQYLKYTIVE